MAEEIYVSRGSSGHGYWVSFENDPHLTAVKRTIRHRCIPCIENLHRQLVEGNMEIELGYAFDCWKVVAVVEDHEECLKVLERYQQRFLHSHHLRGRFGSKEESGTKAIVVNVDSEVERDVLLSELKECVKEINPDGQVFYSRACAYLYEELLGDWHEWGKVVPLKHPENIETVIQRVRELLGI